MEIERFPKPFVYVAGPITGNPFGCVRESIPVFSYVRRIGGWPFMPQWSVLPEMIEFIPYEEWLDYDFDFLVRADALLRLDGESPGADREVEFMQGMRKPTFRLSTESYLFERWVEEWRRNHAVARPR